MCQLKRKLCPYEKFFWFPNRDPFNFNISILGEIDGCLDLASLRKALSIIQVKHSFLSVKVIGSQVPYFQKIDILPIPIRVAEIQTEKELRKELLREIHEPFNLNTGSFVRLVISRNAEINWIIITGDHLIADGISLSSLLLEILDLTFGLPATASECANAIPMSSTNRIGINKKSAFQRKPYRLDKTALKEAEKFAGLVSISQSTGFFSKLFSKLDTKKIIHACKEKNVTVQSALFAASILAIESKIRKDMETAESIPVQYECPVNLRPFLKKDPICNQLSCFIGILNFELQKDKKESFWEIANKAKAELDRAIFPGLEAHIVEQFTDIAKKASSFEDVRKLRSWKGPLVGVSNLGIIPHEKHSRLRNLSVFGNLCGTFYCENSFYLTASTFKHQLTINLFYPKGLMKDHCAKRALDFITMTFNMLNA